MTINHYNNVQTLYSLHVLKNNGVDSYLISDGVHSPKWKKFCADYIPEFPDDSLIEEISWIDGPACTNVKPVDGLGFRLLRHNNGTAVKYSQISRR